MNGLQALQIVADWISGAVLVAGMALTCLAAAGRLVCGLVACLRRFGRFGAR